MKKLVMILATSYKNDSAKSRNWFSRFVVPALRDFGFTDICSVENHDSALKFLLDLAGVDTVARQSNGATVAIASRIIQVKPYGSDYDCFSIRDSRRSGRFTEFEKLQRAIKFNSLRPHFHCQAFVNSEKEMAVVYLTRTKNLIEFVTDNLIFKNAKDGAKFRLAHIQDLRLAGVDVRSVTVKAKK